MSKALLCVLLGLLAGCSVGIDIPKQSNETSKTAQDSSSAEERGEKWSRFPYTIDGDEHVRFTLNATNKIHPTDDESAARIILGCGRNPVLLVHVQSSANGNVRIAFDEAALMRQKWDLISGGRSIGPYGGHPGEKKLLAQMMKAKTFKLEYALKVTSQRWRMNCSGSHPSG